MLGFDSFHIIPNHRIMDTVPHPHDRKRGRISVLASNTIKSTGADSWVKTSNTTSESNYGDGDSERWYDPPSGISIKVQRGIITSVKANMSKLLTGNDHNGIIVGSQEDTDRAMSRLWDVLDTISKGERACQYTAVEFGGVIEHPYTDLEVLLKDRNIPGLRKTPLHRRGESLKFGAAKRAEMSLQIYDKGKQLNRLRPWKGMCKLDKDRYSRIELRLSGERLRVYMSDDVRKNNADDTVAAPVTKLVYADWVKKFFEILYSLDPDDTGKIPLVGDNFVQLLAVMAKHDHLRIGGVHVVDLYMAKVSAGRQRRIRNAMSVIHSREVSLRQLVPCDPQLPPVDLVPVPDVGKEIN